MNNNENNHRKDSREIDERISYVADNFFYFHPIINYMKWIFLFSIERQNQFVLYIYGPFYIITKDFFL
jgi:hypothetical protein